MVPPSRPPGAGASPNRRREFSWAGTNFAARLGVPAGPSRAIFNLLGEATTGASSMNNALARRTAGAPLEERLAALDWQSLGTSLDEAGCALVSGVLSPSECALLAGHYEEDARFRSRVVMARHGFGRGEYKYLAYPLPEIVQRLREALYPPLAAIANRWHEAMGIATRFPESLDAFLARCHRAG